MKLVKILLNYCQLVFVSFGIMMNLKVDQELTFKYTVDEGPPLGSTETLVTVCELVSCSFIV